MGIERVTERFGELPYMRPAQAALLRDFIHEQDVEQVLELGFFHGKSSCYIAEVLEERGRGHLTTIDLQWAVKRSPAIFDLLSDLGLEHRVTPVLAERSFTWELQKMLAQDEPPAFDLIYIDGGHTWDGTGFGFFLCDLVLRPGGWLIFDDMNWSPARSIATQARSGRTTRLYDRFSDDELAAESVRKVWDLLVPSRGYVNMYEEAQFSWGFAQKPRAAPT